MAFIDWEQRYSVGFAALDQQHQQLFGLLNGMHEAMSRGQGREIQEGIVSQLAQYTKSHFTSEELFVKSIAFPEAAAHQAKHALLLKQVQELQQKMREGAAPPASEVLDFLVNWLRGHILHEDMQYATWAKQRR